MKERILTTAELAAEISKRKEYSRKGVSALELAKGHELLGNQFVLRGSELVNLTVREFCLAQAGLIHGRERQ